MQAVAKGGDPVVTRAELGYEIGSAVTYRAPGEVALISTGIMLGRALRVADGLEKEGVRVGVLHVHTVKPLDEGAVLRSVEGCKAVLTLEEHSKIGGLGSAVAEVLAESPSLGRLRFKRLALPDAFPTEYGSQDQLLAHYRLDEGSIVEEIRRILK